MGNSQSKTGSSLADWEKVDTENGIQIYRNNKNKQLAEKRTVVIDPQYDLDDELRLYAIRQTNNDALVRSLGTQNFNKSKNKKSEGGCCSQQRRLNVLTQKIPYRLSDMPQLTFPESLHFLGQSLRAYEVIYKKQGPVHVTGHLIGVNQHGQVKSWINQNWAMNHASHELPTLQSTRLGSLSKEDYLSFGGKYRDEQQMVNNIMAVVQQKCQQGKFPKQFSQQTAAHSTSFRKIRQFLHNFVDYNHIYIPPKINYETVMVSKYQTRLVEQLNRGRQLSMQAQNQNSNQQNVNIVNSGVNSQNAFISGGNFTSGHLGQQVINQQPYGYNQQQIITTKYEAPVINTSFGQSGAIGNKLNLSASNPSNLVQSQTVTRTFTTGKYNTGNIGSGYGDSYNFNSSIGEYNYKPATTGTIDFNYKSNLGTGYDTNYSTSNYTSSYNTKNPQQTLTSKLILNTTGYKNTNPQNYQEFTQIAKNSNLIDGLSGELVGPLSTNSVVNPKSSSQYQYAYKFDNIDKIKPYQYSSSNYTVSTSPINNFGLNNTNSNTSYTNNYNYSTSSYLTKKKDSPPIGHHYNPQLDTKALHGLFDYYKDIHPEDKSSTLPTFNLGNNNQEKSNTSSTYQSSYYMTSKPVYQTTTFTKQYKVGSGVSDSISSSYDANYSSKFGTGSNTGYDLGFGTGEGTNYSSKFGTGSSSGYNIGYGSGQGTTTIYNNYAVGGGYSSNSYQPSYSSTLNGYSNKLLKYENTQNQNTQYSGPKIEGKYADAFSKLIGGSFSNSSGTNENLNSSFGNNTVTTTITKTQQYSSNNDRESSGLQPDVHAQSVVLANSKATQ